MTSSETRTDSRKKARKKQTSRKGETSKSQPSRRAEGDLETNASKDQEPAGIGPQIPPRVLWIGFALLLVGGWLAIMDINRWYFGPPVFFLCTGWLAVLLTGRFLWNAGMAAAEEDDGTLEEEFWRAEGPADELQREKRSLLKAIKEIEFDRQMGKMSDSDAKELTHFYRSRAIQIIKALERVEGEGELSIADKIDREVKARMSIAHASAKGKAAAKAKEAKAKEAKAKGTEAKGAKAKGAKAKAKNTSDGVSGDKAADTEPADKATANKSEGADGAATEAEKPAGTDGSVLGSGNVNVVPVKSLTASSDDEEDGDADGDGDENARDDNQPELKKAEVGS